MGDLIEFKKYVPVIDQLEARLDELPEWCRDAVAHVIRFAHVGADIARQRGETLLAIQRALTSAGYPPAEEGGGS